MFALVGSVVSAFLISFFTLPLLIRYSRKRSFFDAPGDRRIHKSVMVTMGGVAIFFGFFIASLIWLDFKRWPYFNSLIGILFFTTVLGFCDDLVHLRPITKIAGQLIAGSLVFFLLDTRLTSTYELLENVHFPLLISYLVTVFAIIIITNSFNLIDGIDGLAGAFAAISFAFFGTWFYLIEDHNFSILSFSLVGAVIAFLIFNWEPSKIFMGDTGALFIGMMLSILTIRFIEANAGLPFSSLYKFQATISTALSVVILPVVDTIRIIIIRLSKGSSPLVADKKHIHHRLIALGLQHREAVILLMGVYLIFIAIVCLFRSFNDAYVLPVIALLATALCLVLDRYPVKR